MPTEEEITAEQQRKQQEAVQAHLNYVSVERVDRVMDMIAKLTAFVANHPVNKTGQSINALVAAQGNFAGLPSKDEILANPQAIVPKLEMDLMSVYSSLQRGSMNEK